MLAVLLCASLHELLSSCFACFGLLFVGGVPVPVLLSSRSVLSVALRPHACMLADVGAPCRRERTWFESPEQRADFAAWMIEVLDDRGPLPGPRC